MNLFPSSPKGREIERESFGILLGFLAVSAFALTLSITRYLTGYLSIWDIGLGRSALAALAAVAILTATRQKFPSGSDLIRLAITASGIAFGFPVLTAIGMQTVPASHGGIVLGSLPLSTAIFGCLLSNERPLIAFWVTAILGFGVVVAFSLSGHDGRTGFSIHVGDVALFGAVAIVGLSYAQGGLLARTLGGWQVICWTLVVSLPLLVPLILLLGSWNSFSSLPPQGWLSFLFLSLVNSLIGFFFWNKALAMGGIARVSQVQLLQAFLTIFFSVIFLGESVSATTLTFCGVTVLIVMINRKMTIKTKNNPIIAEGRKSFLGSYFVRESILLSSKISGCSGCFRVRQLKHDLSWRYHSITAIA